jgi:hypothetical protein
MTINKPRVLKLSVLLGFLSLVVYVLNQTILKPNIQITFLHNHLNDVAAGVLLISYINVLSIITKQNRFTLLKLQYILIILTLAGLFWEYITPLYLSKSVADPKDVIAYILGGLIYWLVVRISKTTP